MSKEQIIVRIKDGFIEIDEKNGKAIFRQILTVNTHKGAYSDTNWTVSIYSIHDRYGGLQFTFSNKEKANGFLDLLYLVCVEFDKRAAGIVTDDVKETFIYEYG